jgi:micrococcal nuclease
MGVMIAGVTGLGSVMLICCGGLLLLQPAKPPQGFVASVAVNTPTQPASEPITSQKTPRRSKQDAEVNNVTAIDIFGKNGSVASPTATTAAVPKERPKPTIQPTLLDIDDRTFKVPSFREWSARAGGFKVIAKFEKMVDGQVELSKKTGGVAKVTLEKLAAADVDYVRNILSMHPKAKVVMGKVLAVASSHSLLLSEDGTQKFVELYGIATPEPGEDVYHEAKEALTNMVVDKHVWVEWTETNKDSKLIGIVYVDGRNVNLELVAAGMAWHDIWVSADPRLANAEFIAREKKLGLWKVPNSVPPWEHQ